MSMLFELGGETDEIGRGGGGGSLEKIPKLLVII
jgi:hypothetical protein